MNSAKAFGVIGLVAVSLARPAQAASPAAEASARLLAQVEPQIKAIYETKEFALRAFAATRLPDGSGYLKLDTPPPARLQRRSPATIVPVANAQSWLPVRNSSSLPPPGAF